MNVMLGVHLCRPQASVVISVPLPLPHQCPALELNMRGMMPCQTLVVLRLAKRWMSCKKGGSSPTSS
uniref:Uncharacterized protein n=1 Tax=Anguilla anguilla TaxID=7936 RepID=A0A0E9QMM1_ANGAN